MRSRVLLAAAACLVLGHLAAPASAGLSPEENVLLLEAAGKPVTTSFLTDPNRLYAISVDGVYTYDGTLGLGLADCGHKDPEDETAWINVANVLVDGAAARCSVAPFTATHHYAWTQRGTGRPFTFVIYANAYTYDDTGCLAVTVSAVLPTLGPPVPTGAPVLNTCWRLT
jgi:hypothetical protein